MPKRHWFTVALLLVALAASGCASLRGDKEDEATAEELYAIAKDSLERKNWLTAIEQLRELEAKYPYGAHAEQAQLDTIYAHHRNNQPAQAIAAAERFIKLHPTHRAVDYAYYLKGLANDQVDDSLFGRMTGRDDLSDRDASISREALNAFTDVYTRFPDSRYAADARARARDLTESLAKHELVVAGYYYSRDAHVAVVGRARGIIEEFAETAAVEEALALLRFSYQAIGLDNLAADARRVLALNFPRSDYLGDDGAQQLARRLNALGIAIEG